MVIWRTPLIDSLTGKKRSEPRLREFIESAERVHLNALVLFEWRRGPRLPEEIENQERCSLQRKFCRLGRKQPS